jgi:hypothetical protein
MTALPKDSVISRCCDGKLSASGRKYLAATELGKHSLKRPLVRNALQYLTEDNVNHAETLALNLRVQPSHLRIASVAKIVNPNRGINDDHSCYSAPPTLAGDGKITFPVHLSLQPANSLLAVSLHQQT